jgi:hypothetical protein
VSRARRTAVHVENLVLDVPARADGRVIADGFRHELEQLLSARDGLSAIQAASNRGEAPRTIQIDLGVRSRDVGVQLARAVCRERS